MDPRELRNALGRFPTGVSVIATRDGAGALVGLTANSVTMLGPDPPRLLWSLARQSRSRPAFSECEFFSVNVLGEHQADLARQMAGPGDRYAGGRLAAGDGQRRLCCAMIDGAPSPGLSAGARRYSKSATTSASSATSSSISEAPRRRCLYAGCQFLRLAAIPAGSGGGRAVAARSRRWTKQYGSGFGPRSQERR